MNRDLQTIKLRIQTVIGNCTQPGSSFYKSEESRQAEINRIDTAIKTFKEAHLRALNLETKWNHFKSDIPRLITIHRKVQARDSSLDELEAFSNPVSQSIQSLKAAWDRFEATQEDSELDAGVKNLVQSRSKILRDEIDSLEKAGLLNSEHQTQSSSISVIPMTQVDAASMQSYEETARNRYERQKEAFPGRRPNLYERTCLLGDHLIRGLYGEALKNAFLESYPGVVIGSSLLKFLLLEDSSVKPIPHAIQEPEWEVSKESQESIQYLKKKVGEISKEELEETFLGNAKFSPKVEELSRLLNNAVQGIKITPTEGQMCGAILLDRLQTSDSYEKVFREATIIEQPKERAEFLKSSILMLRSLDPEQFFAAIEMCLTVLAKNQGPEVRNSIIKPIMECLSQEVERNPDIIKSFSGAGFLANYLNERFVKTPSIFNLEDARLCTLFIPGLYLLERRRALLLVDKVLKYARLNLGFIIPAILFQVLIRDADASAWQVSKYLRSSDKVQCQIQRLHFVKGSGAKSEELAQCVQESLASAVDFMSEILLDYLDDPTPGNAWETKVRGKQLLSYLIKELKDEAFHVHLPQGLPEGIEAYLLLSCISKASAPIIKNKLRLMIIPELVRIGQKGAAIDYARECLQQIKNTGSTTLKDMNALLDSLLKASGIYFERLDRRVFGTLLEPQDSKLVSLDEDLLETYFDAFKIIRNPEERAVELIAIAAIAGNHSREFNNKSYGDFSRAAALQAFNYIKEINSVNNGSPAYSAAIRRRYPKLLMLFIQDLNTFVPDLVLEAQKELFKFEKDYLITLTDPVAKIGHCIALFRQFGTIRGLERESLDLARQALALNPSWQADQNRNVKGQLIKLVSVSCKNLMLLLGQTGDARLVALEIRQLILESLLSVENREVRIRLLVRHSVELQSVDAEFSVQLATQALTEIKAMSWGLEGTIETTRFRHFLLIQFLEGFGQRIPALVPEATELLEKMQNEVFEHRELPTNGQIEMDLVAKLSLLDLLCMGFVMTGEFDQAVKVGKEFVDLLDNEEHLLSGFIRDFSFCIRVMHNKKGEGALFKEELGLAVCMLDMIQVNPDYNARISALISLPGTLIAQMHRPDAFHTEFSKHALSRALKEISLLDEELSKDPNCDTIQKQFLEKLLIEVERVVDPTLKLKVETELREKTESIEINEILALPDYVTKIERSLQMLPHLEISREHRSEIENICRESINRVADSQRQNELFGALKVYFPNIQTSKRDVEGGENPPTKKSKK